jgi:hypothetical protein
MAALPFEGPGTASGSSQLVAKEDQGAACNLEPYVLITMTDDKLFGSWFRSIQKA